MGEIGPEMVVSVPRGWQCPVCGRVYAPFMPMCSHCGGVTVGVDIGKGDMTVLTEWLDVFRTCGKCGGRMQWHKDIALTSRPAKWEYRCVKCGNVEYEEIGTAKPAYQITLNAANVENAKGGK